MVNYTVILFSLEDEGISVTIKAYFEGQNLVVEGYDIGKIVEESWGDSDYEYVTNVPAEEVPKLYPLFDVKPGNKLELLYAIKDRFHDNFCYSNFSEFLRTNDIKSDGYSWT